MQPKKINVTISPENIEAVTAAASAVGMPINEWVHCLLKNACEAQGLQYIYFGNGKHPKSRRGGKAQ